MFWKIDKKLTIEKKTIKRQEDLYTKEYNNFTYFLSNK